MWVIRIKNEQYQVGYYVELNGLMQFEVFDTQTEKLVAMRLCHYLNGGDR